MRKYKRRIRNKDFLALIGVYHLLYIVKRSARIILKGKDSKEEANKQ